MNNLTRPKSYAQKSETPRISNWPKASIDQVGNLIAEYVEVQRVLTNFEHYSRNLEQEIDRLRHENEFLLKTVDEYENPE